MTDKAVAPAPPKRWNTKRFLLTGLATLLPTLLTGYIIYVCYSFVHTNLGGWLAWVLGRMLGDLSPDERVTNPAVIAAGDILAVVIVLGVALLAGAMTASFIGRQIIRAGEKLILRVPIIRVIYPYVKQITDFFLGEKKMEFNAVVAVPFPRAGIYSLGFLTGESMRSINAAAGEEMVRVFLPCSPTPVTGYLAFVPRREVVPLPITVEEAFALLVSGGVITPPGEIMAASSAAAEKQELPVPEGSAWAGKP